MVTVDHQGFALDPEIFGLVSRYKSENDGGREVTVECLQECLALRERAG